MKILVRLYYFLKPFIPRCIRIFARRKRACRTLKNYAHVWPIDENAKRIPAGWNSWPDGKRFAFVLAHDVETERGHDRCLELLRLEKSLGYKSCFNFVPERYRLSEETRKEICQSEFEIGVHGLKHDGFLYFTEGIFRKRAQRINRYLSEWGAQGFHSPLMQHKKQYVAHLNIKYDQSTFDTDPFEPQPTGVQTIFPYRVQVDQNRSYIEIPYTLAQDHTLFIILQEESIELWRRKVDWIVEHGGMVYLKTHPDYMTFPNSRKRWCEYPLQMYLDILHYIQTRYRDQYWHALPYQVAQFCNDSGL
jgi:hypothetical protein